MLKYEWKKQDKALYLPKSKPMFIDVPKMSYFTTLGKGNPNSPEFQNAVQALYSLSYAIRMSHKTGEPPKGYYEYTVYPLEGIWDLDEEGRKLNHLDKNHLVYKLLIRQPDFLTEELFQTTLENVIKNKPNPFLHTVQFEEIEEGPSVQMMHVGSFNEEPKSFEIMENYCDDNGWTRLSKIHKEIYISDPRKTSEDRLKTVLRFQVSLT